MIAIVYGSGTDWLKSVLASGAAAIVHQGDAYPVGQPEIVPMDSTRAYFTAGNLMGVVHDSARQEQAG